MHATRSATTTCVPVADLASARWLISAPLFAYLFLMLRTGWLSEDAFVTLRVVDNWANGFGLRWNVEERIQVFTHPLWVFALSAVYFVTREAFYSTIVFCTGISFVTVAGVAFSSHSWMAGAAAVTLLMMCRGFVDFSTGGLENPLAHLLLAVFAVQYVRSARLHWLLVLAGVAMCVRLDLGFILVPAVTHLVWRSIRELGWTRTSRDIAIGLLPLAAWLVFALLYYGDPLPKPAREWIDSDTPWSVAVQRGLSYLFDSARWDPIGMLAILAAAARCLTDVHSRRSVLFTGVGLYLAYVIVIGGDSVQGRMLTTCVFLSVLSVCGVLDSHDSTFRRAHILLVAGLLSAALSLASWRGTHPPRAKTRPVLDSRAALKSASSLELVARAKPLPMHPRVAYGRQLRRHGPTTAVVSESGFTGFFAGPLVDLQPPPRDVR